jgi:hypothetical protein
MNSSQLAPYQITMLIGGIVLFLLATGLIVFLSVKKRSTKPALILLPLAILMIGFPSIKSFKGLGFELDVAVQLVEDKARALEENPDDKTAESDLKTALAKLEANVTADSASAQTAETIAKGQEALGNADGAIKWANVAVKKAPNSSTARLVLDRAKVTKSLPSNPNAPLPPTVRSNLASAATQLSTHQNLSPASRITLAKAQLALGQTNAAKANLQQATSANTNLVISPELLRRFNLRTSK